MRADTLRRGRYAAAIVVGALLVLGVRCNEDREPIRIGVAGLFDGLPAARDNLMGMQMAVDEANATGGVRGRPVEAVVRNDNSSGEQAAHIAAEFVADRGISVVVGHSSSAAMLSAATVYHAGMPAIATTASSPTLSGISPWVFRVISSDSATGAALARFAMSRGWGSAAVLYQNDVYGRGLSNAFRAEYRGRVISNDPIVETSPDYASYVRYYARMRPEVVVVLSGRGWAAVRAQRDLAAAGVRAAILASEGATDLSHAPGSADDVFVVAPFSGMETRPKARQFIATFRRRFGHTPDHNAALAFDATTTAIAALRAVGPDRGKIRAYLASRDATHAVEGVSGPIHFNALGDRADAAAIVLRVHGGAVSVVAEHP